MATQNEMIISQNGLDEQQDEIMVSQNEMIISQNGLDEQQDEIMVSQNEMMNNDYGEIKTSLEAQENKISLMKKLRELLNNGDYHSILPFLSADSRESFTDAIVEAYDERLSKLFWRNLEHECLESFDEAEKRRYYEDIQAAMTLEDLKRSQKNAGLRSDVTSQINELKVLNSQRGYLTLGDKHFLEDHDEVAFLQSNQKRANLERKENFEIMDNLGHINNVGHNKILRSRIIDSIQEILKKKRDAIMLSGDANNSVQNYDRQLQQLYSVLDDLDKSEEAITNHHR